MASSFVELPRDTNQALGIGQYAIDFMREGQPGEAALRQVERFHLAATMRSGRKAFASRNN